MVRWVDFFCNLFHCWLCMCFRSRRSQRQRCTRSLESLGTALASDRCDLASSEGAALTLSSAKRTDFCFLRGLRDDVASRDRMLRVVTKLACDTNSTGGEGSFGTCGMHFYEMILLSTLRLSLASNLFVLFRPPQNVVNVPNFNHFLPA